MKLSQSGKLKIVIVSLVFFQATPSHAFIFRLLFGRPLFGRRVVPSSNRFVSRRVVNNPNSFNNNFNNNFNNRINGNNLEEIAGFSNLLKNGNNLVERNARGEVRPLFIDGAGNLRGATEVDTVRQAREFFLTNRDKFNANQRNTVDRFLARNGGISNGRFTFDLKNIILPEGVPPEKAQEAALAALNFLLNTIQTNVRLKIPPSSIKPDGTVDVDLSPFLRGEALALLQTADPTSACTGKFRLDRVISFVTDPKNYYQLINAPKTSAELAAAVGIQIDKTRTAGNKLFVGTDKNGEFESGPTNNLRIIEVQSTQRIPGSTCYRSLDVNDRNPPGVNSESRDVRIKGINFTHDAEEWLCLGRNGMMQGFLFSAAGQRVNTAPAEIATGALGTVGPAISPVIACLDCHAGGFLAGGVRSDVGGNYTERINDIPDTATVFRNSFGKTLTHRDFFVRNATYVQRAQRDTQIYLEAMRATGSFFSVDGNKPFPLLPKYVGKYGTPLKPADIARSLGVSEEAAKSILPPGENALDRGAFEAKFCNLRSGSTLPIDENRDRDLFRRELRQNQPFGGGATHIR